MAFLIERPQLDLCKHWISQGGLRVLQAELVPEARLHERHPHHLLGDRSLLFPAGRPRRPRVEEDRHAIANAFDKALAVRLKRCLVNNSPDASCPARYVDENIEEGRKPFVRSTENSLCK